VGRETWVSSDEICRVFGLRDDRPLRQVGSRPGLCTTFAISGDKGFRHVSCATKKEWLTFKHKMRRHAVREMVRTRDLEKRRSVVLREYRRPAIKYEVDSGQAVFALEGTAS